MQQSESAPAIDVVEQTEAEQLTTDHEESLNTNSTPAPAESEHVDTEAASQPQTETASPLPTARVAEAAVSRQSRALQNAVIDPVAAQQTIICEQCGGPGVFWAGPTFSAKHVCAGKVE